MKKNPKHTQKKLRIKSVLRYAAFAFIGLIIGLFLYNQNAKGILGDRMPMPFGYGMAVVLSGSMEDRLSVDDLVIIKATDDYAVNDIVVYQDGGSLVIHRIIEMDGDSVTTKGDANNTADEPIDKSQIKGVLIFNIPKIGAAVHIMKQPVFMIVMLAAAIILIELSYAKEKDKDTEELDKIKAEIDKLKQDET